ncbi:low molecular weight protein-tyrosine-phosphatase [Caenimonas koreensis]|uniref:low molecular weight protein-tyrosine-phosphatase n=1 Tax=Caenimonas koreensis TaxID=367474 RepID=UPI003784C40C
MQFKVLFVCMGNICRSPTAEGVFRHMVRQSDVAGKVRIDSAGTLDYHVGSPPDHRSQRHARLRGYDLGALRARQVKPADFAEFDLILGMDWQNIVELEALCPKDQRHKVRRLMEFAPPGMADEVPDPYAGGEQGFKMVLDQVEAACKGLLLYTREQLVAR